MTKIKLSKLSIQGLILFLILIVGIFYIRFTWVKIENQQFDNIIQIAKSIETTLPKDDLKALEAKLSDTAKPQYHLIKNTLKDIIRVYNKARFAYLYTKQNDKIYFIADSEPENSIDYSPPGQEYTEAKPEDKQPFIDGKDIITIAVEDRWGTWTSVLIPIKDELTGKTIAVFGMDFNTKAWNKVLLFEIIESSILIIFLFFAIILFFIVKTKNSVLEKEISERKNVEYSKQKSDEKYRLIFEYSPIGLLYFNEKGVIDKCNDKFVEIIGSSKEKLISLNMLNLPDKKLVSSVQQALNGNVGFYEDFYHSFTSNKITPIRAIFTPMLSIDGKFSGGIGIIEDNTERKKAEEILFNSKERAQKQSNAIAHIAIDEVISFGELKLSFERLTKEVATAMQVERTSIWLLSDDNTELQCISLYENKTNIHSSGAILKSVDYPHYFETIYEESRISVNDAQNDIRTNEFTKAYLAPLDISSMLDSGIYVEGKLKGVVCFEHVGEKRNWYSDEESFASTIASIASQILLNNNRKQVEKTLQDIIDKNPMSIQILDMEGYVIQTNPAFIKLFGVSPPADYSIFKDTQLIQQGLGELFVQIKKGEVVYFPDSYFNVHDFDPSFPDLPVWIKAIGFTLNDSNGNPNRVVLMHENITERKNAEKQLNLLKRAVDQSPVTVVITDKEGNIEYTNPKFIETTGYSFDEVVGKNPRVLKSGEQTNDYYKNLWETILSGNNWHGEFLNKKKNGELYWESAVISPIANSIGEISDIIAIKEDITEKKKMLQDLIESKEHAEESDRLKTAFLCNMSHEIRTPMNGILGFAELLKEPGLSNEQQQEYIQIIEKGGARMLNIINDIMSISKIESGTIEVNNKETNINEHIEFIYNFFKPELEAKGMNLSFKNALLSNQSVIITDSEKVYSILTNLVKNAIKYSKKGSIAFGYEKKDNYLEFYVKDTGIGIPKDRQKAIFERFIQADIQDKNAYQGAGLGLSISKAYVEMLNGKIWVESEVGVGSCFYFTLPYNVEREEKNVFEKVILLEKENNLLKNLKILIADDDDVTRMIISMAVKRFCKDIIEVENGIEVLEACRNNPDIDLIIMDVKMPEMDGYEATKQIRMFNTNVIIILQSAFTLSGEKENAALCGCNDYLPKPFTAVSLIALLNKHFKK